MCLKQLGSKPLKHDFKTIANFARSKGTSQRPLRNKEVSVNSVLELCSPANTATLKIKETHRRLDFGPDIKVAEPKIDKLSQDPGRGYTFSERLDQKTSTHQ